MLRSFSYNFVLPGDADCSSVASTLENGRLRVEYGSEADDKSSRRSEVSESSVRVGAGSAGLNVIREEVSKDKIQFI